MAEFLFNLSRTRDGLRNLIPEQLTIPLAEPMHGHPRGSLRHPQPGCGAGVVAIRIVTGEKMVQSREHFRFAGPGIFLVQPVQSVLDECGSPTPLKDALGA